MENAELCSYLEPSQFPAGQNVLEIVIHSNHEEEIPAFESLLEDGHLAKPPTTATTADKDR